MFASYLRGLGNRVGLRRFENEGFVKRREQAFLPDGFQEVIDGVEFKRLHCILIVRSDKDELGRRFHFGDMACDFQSIHHRHANVGEHNIDTAFVDDLDGFHTVSRFVNDRQRELLPTIIEQIGEAPSRRSFVIDNQDSGCGLRHRRQMVFC